MAVSRVVGIVLVLMLAGCRPGSPVAVDDPPLAERLEQRRSTVLASGDVARVSTDPATPDSGTPDELAFAPIDARGTTGASLSQPIVAEIVGSPLGVKLRTGPGPGYHDVLIVPADALVHTTGNITGEWMLIRYGDFEGWVPVRVLRPSESSTGDTIPVDGESVNEPGVVYVVDGAEVGVNMRSAPDANSQLVSGAPVGSLVMSTGRTHDEWVEVEFNGVIGWAFGGYLRPTESEGSGD